MSKRKLRSTSESAILLEILYLHLQGPLLTFGRLVLETLDPLPGDRKCFRMINGVLVERTVQDVLPQLKTNADGLKKVLDDLLKQYTTKQEELEKWKVCISYCRIDLV